MRRGLARSVVACLLASFSMACASGGPATGPEPVAPGWSETGVASWYGPGFHGRATASGEVFDMEAMTAAHPWLPFGTVVRVVNRENGRATAVRINDRGPFKRGRILDLSRAAARELGMLGAGTAEVRLTILEAAAPGCSELQVGAYGEPRNARAAAERVRDAGWEAGYESGPRGLVRVIAGPFEDPAEARAARERLGGALRPCPVAS